MLLAAPAARAFDFRAQAPSGQWIYYTVIDDNSVKVVNPDWDSRTPPSGVLTIPATATNSTNGTTYNVTVIDAEAFKSCDGLTTVVIPEGVTRIGRMAFAYCTALDSVSLPSTLTYIGSMAFTSTSFYSTSHLNADGLLIAGAYLIGSLSSITGSITVPEGVQGLGNMAFYNCASMERVNLPAGLRFIGENAFQDCRELDTVELHNIVPPALESNAFTNADQTVILVPCHQAAAYQAAEYWSSHTIEENCSSVGIAAVESDMPTITIVEGGINLDLSENETATISDMTGRRVAESMGGFVALPSHGVYIVSIPGMKSAKVVY